MHIKHISRIDTDDTHGWFYRHYQTKKNIHSKFFSDSRYGSKEAALEATIEYKTAYEKKHPQLPRKGFLTKLPKNNTSGVVGVSETYTQARGGSKEMIPCFSVNWSPEPNRSKIKKFLYYDNWTREEAFRDAVAFRKEVEEEMLQNWKHKVAKIQQRANSYNP